MTPPKPTGLPTPHGMKPAPDIPSLKKKEEKEKKGGGAALTGGSSGGGGGSFLSRWFGIGGRGAGSALGRGAASTVARSGIGAAGKLGLGPMLVNFLASNMAAVLFTGLVTGGAVYTLYSLGMSMNAEKPAKTSVFPQAQTAAKADASGDPADGRVDASGLSYFQTANQGGAFGEELKKADAPAAEPAPETPPADAVAPAVGEQAPAGGAPQIADALAQHLEKPKMVAAKGMPGGGLGGGNGLAGGSGLSGGMMKKFDPKGADLSAKNVTPIKRDSQAKLVTRKVSPIANAKGGSMTQLRAANSLSRKALGQTSSEGQSFQAAEAFNTAPAAQAGKDIAGSGVGDGGKGVDPSASGDGGPISRTGEETPPDTGKKEDKSPYSSQLMMAQALLMTASAIITIIGILAIIKDIPLIGLIAEMWQKILYGAAIAMAAAAAAIGAMVSSQYGQKDQGMIVTVGGGITSAAATAALFAPPEMQAWIAVLGGIAGLASSIGSMLVPMMKGGGMGGSGGSGSSAKK